MKAGGSNKRGVYFLCASDTKARIYRRPLDENGECVAKANAQTYPLWQARMIRRKLMAKRFPLYERIDVAAV